MEKIKNFLLKNKGILITILVVGLAFFGLFKLSWRMNMQNMGGTHSWLSGSTIKFVNNWLDEGAANLKFTNYEDPKSIEFETLEDREPYLSYPSGETFFVYLAAKMTGRQQITVAFLHKFQIVMFAIEALLLATFVYYFLAKTLNRKSDLEKIIIASLSAVLWMILPICSYYLPNIYYADQCVILWILGFLLLEYLLRANGNKNIWLKLLRCVILYSGILIDYYFWFFALMLFIAEVVEVWLKNGKKERWKKILGVVLWFGIPTILALATYYIQLTLTEDWFGLMSAKFSERIVGEGRTTEWIFETIFYHFSQAFTLDGGLAPCLLTLMVGTGLGGTIFLARKKKIAELIKNPGISVVVCAALAIVLQIYFFKQHSAIHEFSMIKVALLVALLPILMATVSYYAFGVRKSQALKIGKVTISNYLLLFLIAYLLVFVVTGVPTTTDKYSKERLGPIDFTLEYAIRENTDYNDVVFSYSKEIPANPPQFLAISKKRVYKVENVEDISSKMSGLKEEAKVVLVIEKAKDLKDSAKIKQQQCLKNSGNIRLENDQYILVELKDYKKCV